MVKKNNVRHKSKNKIVVITNHFNLSLPAANVSPVLGCNFQMDCAAVVESPNNRPNLIKMSKKINFVKIFCC